jgi:hypothetical protein
MPKKRGRPPASGRHLGRDMAAVKEFHEARGRGEKFEQALEEAAKVARQRFPELKTSAATVKRALRMFQPDGADNVFLISERSAEEAQKEFAAIAGLLPDWDTTRVKRSYVLSVGPKPQYKRHNAKTK